MSRHEKDLTNALVQEQYKVKNLYGDLLDIPRPVSKRHLPMDMKNRAAQFMPFAALTGFGDAVKEKARLTGVRKELTEERKAELDEKIRELMMIQGQEPEAELTYYVPDRYKEGGAYVTIRGKVRKIDQTAGVIIFADATAVRIEDVSEIKI